MLPSHSLLLGTFSITFFMGNCKPQTANRKMSRNHGLAVTFAVCSSRLNRRNGFQRSVIYGKVFCTKNCTASRLKVWTSFLYPFAMCLLDFWSRINELLLSFGRLKWCTSIWWKQHGGSKHWTRSSNQFYIRFCRTNKGKYSVPIQCYIFFLSCYWIHNLTQSLFSSYF